MNLELEQYPQFIANLERDVLKLNRDRDIYEEKVNTIFAAIDAGNAFDLTLKNEQQRKAKREEKASQTQGLPSYLAKITQLQTQIDLKKIELNQTRNEFTIAKLRLREKIALTQLTSELPLMEV